MIFGFPDARRTKSNEQLVKLYWNRAAVKRELRDLRRERYELLDKLKEHEASIARARAAARSRGHRSPAPARRASPQSRASTSNRAYGA